MATWYFSGAVDLAWGNVSNWNSQPDFSGSAPTSVPWTDATTADDDLVFDGEKTYVLVTDSSYNPINIGSPTGEFEITGTCYFNNDFALDLLFAGTVESGSIEGGTYTAPIISMNNSG